MSQESVVAVKSAYAAWAADGLDAFAEHMTEDVEWRAQEGSIDDPGPLYGREAVIAYLQDWIDTVDDFKVEPLELIDAGGDRVVAALRYSGRTKHGGVELPGTDFAAVYVMRDGKIARGGEYESRAEALEAAGVPE